MTIFNSLGSNYQFSFVLLALSAKGDQDTKNRLKEYLENRYQGNVFLLYKGREAIELALRMVSLPKDSFVAFNGFTCYAVYKAVINAGYHPAYVDITDLDLNFSANSLKESIKKNSKIKVVIIQNTLGYPCDIEAIAKICKEKKIILIEDLAHSIGTVYANGQEAGKSGDFTILSFSQDKMIDGISGGALIVRNKESLNKNREISFDSLDKKQQCIDRYYPLFTFLIRKTYASGLGKILHEILKRLHVLSNPMSDLNKLSELPSWYCHLIYTQFIELKKNIAHRKKIASIYAANLNKKIVSKKVCNDLQNATNLRFPVFIYKREELIKYLKEYGIFVSDIWYDAPIAPKKYIKLTDYSNECPGGEELSKKILNLPTHKNISEMQARLIADKINLWLTSQ